MIILAPGTAATEQELLSGVPTRSPATNVRARFRLSKITRCRARPPVRSSTGCCETNLCRAKVDGAANGQDREERRSERGREACSAWIARFLKQRGVDRIFGLQGGHIQPIWDHVARQGIRIIDVRDEGAAVHMAHAHAELTGQLGVAMVTAGPGVTNTVTAICNASLARAPVLLIGGCTSRPQANMGPASGHSTRRYFASRDPYRSHSACCRSGDTRAR